MENNAPWATADPAAGGAMKLAAFATPFSKITGGPPD
jgi:hypothetical protein